MTQKFWWMALPVLILLGARAGGAPPTKADCPACAQSKVAATCCPCECAKAKTAALMEKLKTLYQDGKFNEAEQIVSKVFGSDSNDPPAAQVAAYLARLMISCATGQDCCEGFDCCSSGKCGAKCCDDNAACCKDGSCCKKIATGRVTIGIGVKTSGGLTGNVAVKDDGCKCCGSCQCPDCAKCQKAAAKAEPRYPAGVLAESRPPVGLYYAPSMGGVLTPSYGGPAPAMPIAPAFPVPVPPVAHEYLFLPAPVAPPPALAAKSYEVEARLVETAPGEKRHVHQFHLMLAENARGRARIADKSARGSDRAEDPTVCLSAKVRSAKAGKVRVQLTVQGSESFHSKARGTMVVSDRCRISRDIALGKWVKMPLEPEADGDECGCWVEVMVKEVGPMPATAGKGRAAMVPRVEMAPPPPPQAVIGAPVMPIPPAPACVAAPCPAPVGIRQVIACSAAGVVKSAATCQIKVSTVNEELAICNGTGSITCETMAMKMAGGRRIEVAPSNVSVKVSGSDFRAFADTVTANQKDELILEGGALLYSFTGDKRTGEFAGSKIILRLNQGELGIQVQK